MRKKTYSGTDVSDIAKVECKWQKHAFISSYGVIYQNISNLQFLILDFKVILQFIFNKFFKNLFF